MNKSGDEYLLLRSEEDSSMSQEHPASLGIDVAKAKFDAALLCQGKLAQRAHLLHGSRRLRDVGELDP
jgi:hypothetical protein